LAEAKALATFLKQNYRDDQGKDWTDHNFGMLRTFCHERWGLNPDTCCFHRKRRGHTEDRSEFLWDFIAATRESGVLLAVESEQASHTGDLVRGLHHDFEKLLYVFAPIRLLIVKGKSEDEKAIIDGLVEYAGGCCTNFNPGSVFLIHFGRWRNAEEVESLTYSWQSDGCPAPRGASTLKFEPL